MEFYNSRRQAVVEGLVKLPQFGSASGGTHRPLNSYALIFGAQCVLFDAPVSNAVPGIRGLIEDGITPVACVLSHADIAESGDAFGEMQNEFGLPLMLHPADQADPRARRLGIDWVDPMNSEILAALPLRVLHWPGHSPGSIMLYTPEHGGVLLTGDSAVAPGPMQPDEADPLVRPPAPSSHADEAVLQRWRDLNLNPLRTLAPLHGQIAADRDDIAALIAGMLRAEPMKQEVRRTA